MEERIELEEPELVAMRPEEQREAICLLAALIRATSASPLSPANRVDGSFEVGPATGERGGGGRRGTT
jgi:hypothetical protein